MNEQAVYDPTNWGWKLCDGKFMPLWMTQGKHHKNVVNLLNTTARNFALADVVAKKLSCLARNFVNVEGVIRSYNATHCKLL